MIYGEKNMKDAVVIGIGDYTVVTDNTPITTIGLGSCIGIVLYDPTTNVSGMSHIMLPEIGVKKDKIGKYADSAIPALLEEMKKVGAKIEKIQAKIAGGASIFDFTDDILKIGDRNAKAVRDILKEFNIRLVNKDIGGKRGRTITFYPENKELFIKMVKKEPNDICEKTI
ncbi:chemotaxis protein CheD [Thermoplasmatales archaeon ex4572_165]|nr:MAG: chemotaxis protein CheD [Thermoplasmatales archaeon ex4572_165]